MKRQNQIWQRLVGVWRTRRTMVLVVGLFAFIGSFLLIRSFAIVEPPTETISGEFIHAVQDDFKTNTEKDVYVLKQNEKEYVDVDISASAGKVPKTGSKVRIKGNLKEKRFKVKDNNVANIAVEAAPSVDSTVVSDQQVAQEAEPAPIVAQPAGPATRFYTRGVVIVNLNVTDGSTGADIRSPARSDAEEAGYLAGGLSPDNYWSESSYGTMSLTSTVLGTVTINVTATSCSTAKVNTWADQADTALRAAGKNPAQFTHMTYLLPIQPATAATASCNWGGLGIVNGARSWLAYGYSGFNPDGSQTRYLMGTESHEFGHNLGLLHAASKACTSAAQPVVISATCTDTEYGDLWDVMGSQSGYRLLSGYHRAQLGFLPTSKIQTITASGTYTLASSDVDPINTTLPQSLRIARTGSVPAQFYDVEVRSPSGTQFDNFAANSTLSNGMSIRVVPSSRPTNTELSYLLDGNPESASFADSAFYRSSFSDPATNTGIRLISSDRATNSIRVSVTINGVAPPAPTGDNIVPTVALTAPASTVSVAAGAVVNLAATAADNLGVAKVEFYNGTTLLGTDTTSPFTFAWNTTGQAAGAKSVTARAYDAANNTTTSTAVSVTVTGGTTPPPAGGSTPFSGTAVALPGRVEAENFDNGGEGVAFHDTDATSTTGEVYRAGLGVDFRQRPTESNGWTVTTTRLTEYMKYTVNVTQAGQYDVSLRGANIGAGGSVRLDLDGTPLTGGTLQVPNTADFAIYATSPTVRVTLPAGSHVLTVNMATTATGVTPSETGAIDYLQFAAVTGTTPTPTPPPPAGAVSIPYRMNAGGPAFTDDAGLAWSADAFNVGGTAAVRSSTLAIAGTTNDTLYQTERWGMTGYNIPVANGTYTVRLHFAETTGSGCATVGCRIQSVTAEGAAVATNFDNVSQVGVNTANIKQATVTVSDGVLSLGFSSTANSPQINGIEILSTSVTPTPTPPPPAPVTVGDANGDNRVNGLDYSILVQHDGQNFAAADFNGDGTVGAADLAILLSRWTW